MIVLRLSLSHRDILSCRNLLYSVIRLSLRVHEGKRPVHESSEHVHDTLVICSQIRRKKGTDEIYDQKAGVCGTGAVRDALGTVV